MIELIFKGIKRRKQEIRYVSVVTFAATVFMVGITLFQSVMNNYVFQNNLQIYGDWVVSSVGQRLKHPYFLSESSVYTGISLRDEEGFVNRIYMGKVDENFTQLYDEILFEGRIPEQDNEIAMDIVSLQELGYNYDLDQTISIRYKDSDGNIQTKDYQLVGTLRCFAQIWRTEGGYPLANFLVTEQEFDKFGGADHITYFYQLDPLYSEIDTFEFAKSFTESTSITNSKPIVCYNSYVYENRLWGSAEVYRNITLALMGIAALAIGYLLVAYMGKRRGTYYKYRCIGASKRQVRQMILAECLYATVPEIVVGTVLVYGITYVICKIAEHNYKMEEIFAFDGGLLAAQLLMLFGIVVLGILAAQFSISDRRLAGNVGEIKPSKYKKLRRIAGKTSHPEKTIFKRQNAVRPLQRVVSVLFTVLVCGSLLVCAQKIVDSIEDKLQAYHAKNDFKFDKREEYEYRYENREEDTDKSTHRSVIFRLYDMYAGGDENLMDGIFQCPGVEGVKTVLWDGFHYFEWEGMEESPVLAIMDKKEEKEALQQQRELKNTPLRYGMEIQFHEDLSPIQEMMMVWKDEQQMDWQKFAAGEQVIVIIDKHFQSPEDETKLIEVIDETIIAGGEITIKSVLSDIDLPIEVAGVYYSELPYIEFYTNSYLVVGSMALAEKMADLENKELKYNHIMVTYDGNASYQSSDKQLARLATDNGMEYSSQAEERRLLLRTILQEISIYGTLFLMILIAYVVIQRSIMLSKNKYWRAQFKVLKQIGLENKHYFNLSLKEECKAYLWLFAGLILAYIMYFYMDYDYQKDIEGSAVYDYGIGKILTEAWEISAREVIYDEPHLLYLAIVLLLYAVLILMSSMVLKRCIREGETK